MSAPKRLHWHSSTIQCEFNANVKKPQAPWWIGFPPYFSADLPGGYRQPGTGEETCARWSFVMDEAPREIR